MAPPARLKARPGRGIYLLLGVCCLTCVAFLVMWPLGCRSYTSVGIDSDYLESPGIVYSRYWRVRWPGDGSFRVGGGGFRYGYPPNNTKPLQIFDLGGRFFLPPRPEVPHSLWNRAGFWWIYTGFANASSDPGDGKTWQIWAGVPSVLPAVVFAGLALLCLRALKRRRTLPSA